MSQSGSQQNKEQTCGWCNENYISDGGSPVTSDQNAVDAFNEILTKAHLPTVSGENLCGECYVGITNTGMGFMKKQSQGENLISSGHKTSGYAK